MPEKENLSNQSSPFTGTTCPDTSGGGFLPSAIKRLNYYKDLGDKTFAQLADNDFHFTPSDESNSIAVIIQHMHGNMLSRWTDFLNIDGEKEWRKRDAEFEEQNFNKEQLLNFWEEGWKCFLDVLNSLSDADLEKTIHIRSEPLTVVDALNRQFAHYPYHVGQIVYIGRIIKNKDWQSLSIPKGQSSAYNNKMKQ
ncbi:MAG TPA: DUF1572 family protein [Chitinophagaceae bacterium]|nr:DUF1572 family protein [Chitinophagaceae bacterium]